MLRDKAREILRTEWKKINLLARGGKLKDSLDRPELVASVRVSVNSATKTYRYVLPTQILSKLADHSLDSRCVQVARGGKAAFDARTVAHGVVVPFDQRNESVLGGSQEPYVNNPLRIPEISARYRHAQRDKSGWDHLCNVLGAVERGNDPEFTRRVFRQVLVEIYRRLSTVHVAYPVPRRVSLENTLDAIRTFLSVRSGGDRLLALSSALFKVLGSRLDLYTEVRRGAITAADETSGMLADLECVAKGGRVVLAVEVKDRRITISQLKAKVRTIRGRQVSEIFFVATQGVVLSEAPAVRSFVEREFVSGQNVYVTDLEQLSQTLLALIGEDGRRDFLRETSAQLETYRSDITHRRAWASILQKL